MVNGVRATRGRLKALARLSSGPKASSTLLWALARSVKICPTYMRNLNGRGDGEWATHSGPSALHTVEPHALVSGVGQSLQVRRGYPGDRRVRDPYISQLIHRRSQEVLAICGIQREDTFRLQGLHQPEGGGTPQSRPPGQLRGVPLRMPGVEHAHDAPGPLDRLDEGPLPGSSRSGSSGSTAGCFGASIMSDRLETTVCLWRRITSLSRCIVL